MSTAETVEFKKDLLTLATIQVECPRCLARKGEYCLTAFTCPERVKSRREVHGDKK